MLPQHGGDHLGGVGVVLDDDNLDAVQPQLLSAMGGRALGDSDRHHHHREPDGERGALALAPAVGADGATVEPDEVTNDGEAESEAAVNASRDAAGLYPGGGAIRRPVPVRPGGAGTSEKGRLCLLRSARHCGDVLGGPTLLQKASSLP